MTDEPKPLPIGEALEVVCRYARTHQRTSPELQAALATFDGWGEPITEEWLCESVGFSWGHDEYSEHSWLEGPGCHTYTINKCGQHWKFCIGLEKHVITKTRGDLLGLLHFLGVKL